MFCWRQRVHLLPSESSHSCKSRGLGVGSTGGEEEADVARLGPHQLCWIQAGSLGLTSVKRVFGGHQRAWGHILPHCQPWGPTALTQDALGSGQPGHRVVSGTFLGTVSIGPWGHASRARDPQNPQESCQGPGWRHLPVVLEPGSCSLPLLGLFLVMFSIISMDFFQLDAAQAGYLTSFFGVLQMVSGYQGLKVRLGWVRGLRMRWTVQPACLSFSTLGGCPALLPSTFCMVSFRLPSCQPGCTLCPQVGLPSCPGSRLPPMGLRPVSTPTHLEVLSAERAGRRLVPSKGWCRGSTRCPSGTPLRTGQGRSGACWGGT